MNKAFKFIWRKFLTDGNKLVRVTGWRSCIYDDKCGQRIRATFCLFPWELK